MTICLTTVGRPDMKAFSSRTRPVGQSVPRCFQTNIRFALAPFPELLVVHDSDASPVIETIRPLKLLSYSMAWDFCGESLSRELSLCP